MQNYVHHRDPTLFPEPDEFIPDRWLKDSKDMDSAITPFSVGAYNSIGQK
jgi:cytochrome P450